MERGIMAGEKRPGQKWLIPDELWERIEPLLPEGKPHPLGCHNPRVDNRRAMDAIFFRLRTGCQWKALDATGICSGSSAHRRFQEWSKAGVFLEMWKIGLAEYEQMKGIDWQWLSLDGAMTKAPLAGEKSRPQSHRQRQAGHQAELGRRGRRRSDRPLG